MINFPPNHSRRGQSPLNRTPSPRRHLHHDIGFSDTVSNVVEIVKEEHRRGRPYGLGHRFAARGRIHTFHLNDLPHHQKLDVVVCSIYFYIYDIKVYLTVFRELFSDEYKKDEKLSKTLS